MRIYDSLIYKRIARGGGGGSDPSQGATATAADITLGKTAAANGEMLTGTLEPPELDSKTITANGTYLAASDNLDGYDEVTVDVNTDPIKGFVLEDYDANGYPTKARLVGNWTETPTNFTTTVAEFAVIWSKIKELVLPNTLMTIGWASFANYYELEKINIPSSVALKGSAFYNCKKVTEINIDGNVSIDGGQVFNGAISCIKFTVGGNVTTWNNPFYINSASFVNFIPIMLYDFSHCTTPFVLAAWYQLPHANGCVIRVPQALLADWQEETNWIDLNDVVWEGV